MQSRRDFLAAAGSVGVAIAALGWARSAWALSTLKTSSLMLPLSGVFFWPPEPMFNFPGEAVTLAGNVHVLTAWPPNPGISEPTVSIYLNMAGVQGTGQTTNDLYIGTGSANFIGATWPPEPDLLANFSLDPTNGLPSVPLPLSISLAFASNGTLQPESSVSIFVAK